MTLKVYVGWDAREDIAWQVCRHSILRHAPDVEVYPLKQQPLRELGLYTRPADEGAATAFSLTRFLTPYMAAHDGWSVFVDCDFLFTTDIRKVVNLAPRHAAVCCVQHDYTPAHAVKMDGQQQTTYPRKNWSSFILFNGAHPTVRALTPDIVNRALPAHLHRFAWVPDELNCALPVEWNFLVGVYEPLPDPPAAIHYTNGGPWFPEWQDVDYGDLWLEAEREFNGT